MLLIVCLSSPSEAMNSELLRPVMIEDVSVVKKNVFDPTAPGENYWFFRLANYLHLSTRSVVIRNALLFKPGDTVPQELIEESERNLRALPFIKSAEIRSTPDGPGKVNLQVTTQDSWTTQPQLNFNTAGEQSHFGAGFEEDNFLGYGKTVSFFYRSNPQSNGLEYAYSDPQILGSRWTLDSFLLDQTGGNQQRLDIERPFFSLATRAAGGAAWNRSFGPTKVYQNGNQINEYDFDQYSADFYTGVRANSDLLNVQRLNLRYRYSQTTYAPDGNTVSLPSNTAFSGPVLQWSLTQSRFIKETFVDKVDRVEDINLGHVAGISAQYSGRVLGASDYTAPVAFYDNFGWGGDHNTFGLAGFGASGRYNLYAPDQMGGVLRNTIYFMTMNMYSHLFPDPVVTGVFHMESAYVENPDVENPLSLGGNTGLRGFKVNKFTGDKDILANLEARSYIPTEWFHLFYAGGAAFVDAGQAQPAGLDFRRQDFHADVGIGARIATSRSTSGTVFRFDMAYAIGPVDGDPRVVFSVSVGQGFQRTANTFSGYPDIVTSN